MTGRPAAGVEPTRDEVHVTEDGAGRGPVAPVLELALVVALTALAVWLRLPGLDPGSLWLDDAWVALVGRAESWTDVARIVVAAPLHTLLVWASLAIAGGPSELAAQLPAWIVGVATPGLGYLALRRAGAVPGAAALAATVVAVAPVHLVYSTRVKSYTIDALLTIALLYLAVRVLQAGTAPRWRRLTVASLLATASTSVLAIVSAGAVGVPALVGWTRGGAERRRAGVSLAAYLAGAALWYLLVLRRTIRPGLTAFWADRFIPLDDPATALTVARTGAVTILEAVSPLPWGWTVALVAVALAVSVRRHVATPLLVLVPVATALALAVLHAVPWGGGRTDTYLVGVMAVALGLGVDALSGGRRSGVRRVVAGATAGLVAVALVAAGVTRDRPGYPEHDVRAFVETVDVEAAPGEPVIVYPATRWAFALYTSRELTLVDDPATANGFEPVIEDPQVTVLPPLRATPERYREHLATATADAARVWFVGSHWSSDLGVIRQQMDELGFDVAARDERRGAVLTEYVRRAPRG